MSLTPRIDDVETRLDDLEALKIEWQTKSFGGPSNVDGTIFQFNNLEIGKTYRIDLSAKLVTTDATTVTIRVQNNASTKAFINYDSPAAATGSINASDFGVFVAASSTLIVEALNFIASPNRSYESVKATLFEYPNIENTTKWT